MLKETRVHEPVLTGNSGHVRARLPVLDYDNHWKQIRAFGTAPDNCFSDLLHNSTAGCLRHGYAANVFTSVKRQLAQPSFAQ